MSYQSRFSQLTPAQIAKLGKRSRPFAGVIAPVSREGRLPLSFAQQRLWFLSQMKGISQAYHIPFAVSLVGALDETALRRALDRLVWRHEALRTRFALAEGEVFQSVAPAEAGFDLSWTDLSQGADGQARLEALIREEAAAPFDLERGPLARGRLVRLSAEKHVLLLTLHHIVSDGWSMAILTRELRALYEAFANGREDPLEPLAIQYPDYAAWQRRWLSEETLARQSDYWRQSLLGAPTLLELPTDRRRPERQDFAGDFVGFELDAALTGKLKALSQRRGLTLFMTLLTGWALVLSRLSGQDDLVIGTPSANRTRSEVEGLIGCFVNTLALRVDLSGSPTVSQVLDRVRALTLEAQDHQDLPFQQVVEVARPVRSRAHTPLFQVLFSWETNEAAGFELDGLEVLELEVRGDAAKFDLTLRLEEVGDRIQGRIGYATALFDEATVSCYGDYLRRALEAMAAGDDQPIETLEILSPQERLQRREPRTVR